LNKQELRQALRKRRRSLNQQEQKLAALRLARQLHHLRAFRQVKHVAAYWPNDGEINPLPFLEELQRRGAILYLPRVLADGTLEFHRFHAGRRLQPNQYSIPEPVGQYCRPTRMLDVILMPLVGFDHRGNRLGMGGGYYDRTLAFRHKALWKNRPQLIGLAHHFQQVDHLHHDNWDIPLSLIVTDRGKVRPLQAKKNP